MKEEVCHVGTGEFVLAASCSDLSLPKEALVAVGYRSHWFWIDELRWLFLRSIKARYVSKKRLAFYATSLHDVHEI